MYYLNNAATTWPKPKSVIDAMTDFMLNCGANSSRGTSSERDMNAMNLILDCRIKLAELFGGYDNHNPLLVTFTSNITEALNFVLRGFLKPGMKVLTTSMEHNAVMRPLRDLEKTGVKVDVVNLSVSARHLPLERGDYDLMVMSHASNVSGTVQPLKEIAEICKKNNIPLVVDSAQTAGILDINVTELNLAALCFTGHKGLMAPQGTGGIIWNPDFASRVKPIITGGTGSFSHLEIQPDEMPDKFESGTPNLPGIAGLNAALDWLNQTGIKNIAKREAEIGKYFLDKLLTIDDLILTGNYDMNNRVSVFSFNIKNFDNGILADELSRAGFETRPGLHCSPQAHKTLGTFPDGALRVSPGFFTQEFEIDKFFDALKGVLFTK
ncbi:MAG: aminotransferase class V-fold PLP-dependent enzyme [Synergistaceae bacterium]|nr:aminotransferase class V-fold PLP-dependent enzyme [Synergistaceae bacterium]